MKYRMALWASAGFLAAGFWALYFVWANKDAPIDPVVYVLMRLTCPIAIAGAHYPISLYWVLVANAATYVLVGLIAEGLQRQFHHSK
jgi:hypothetical protein